MTLLKRSLAALGLLVLVQAPASAEEALKEFRIGFQKIGILVAARSHESIEKALAEQGTKVTWVEFASGPPLLEAMNVGSIDFGLTGDTPPIFAQAAGANVTYVAALPPNGPGEGLVVKADSPIRTLADLKGRKVGFTKGSSANNLAVVAVQSGGLAWTDIQPQALSPADAAAAFASDAIDAWAIWDPFFALAELRHPVRVLATSADLLTVNTYLLANRDFAAAHPGTVRKVVDTLAETAAWANENKADLAKALHAATGVELAAYETSLDRAEFYVKPITEEIVANQQVTADRFHALGLIPRAIVIQDAVWSEPGS